MGARSYSTVLMGSTSRGKYHHVQKKHNPLDDKNFEQAQREVNKSREKK